MIVIYNMKFNPPPPYVYVGRPSRWGNPFKVAPDVTRTQAIQKYANWILSQEKLIADLWELRGKHLACWCSPSACHAEVLRFLANGPDIHSQVQTLRAWHKGADADHSPWSRSKP